MTKVTLNVSGMHCGSCALVIEMVLKEKKGVNSAKVDLKAKKADIDFDSSKITLDDIKKEISKLGYSAS